MRHGVALTFALALVGCSDRTVLDGAAETSTSQSASTSAAETTHAETTGIVGTDDATSSETTSSTSGSATTDGERGCPFVCPPDVGDDVLDCDIWAQDCPVGEKCMPWANDGGNSWNATRCSPIDPRAVGIGEPCTVEGSGVSGIDDCELGAMCWDVDPETNAGVCIGLCAGSPEAPVCADANAECAILNEGVLILCLDLCDPLLQDCDEGAACFAFAEGFFCSYHGGRMGLYGDPCEFPNACDPGLFCAAVSAVPDCMGSQGCCSNFCDLDVENPDAICPDVALGQQCVPWYEPGHAPPGMQDVGACMMPA